MRALVFLLAVVSLWAVTISTSHFDQTRQNANTQETTLTPSNVTTTTFRKLGTWAVDGHVFAQPLYLPNITISSTTYDVLIAVTMHDTVYAFNANSPGSAALWSTSVGTSRTSYPSSPTLYGAESGCLSTPVADVGNSLLYVACTVNTPGIVLKKIDITTGTILASATVSGQVVGTGDPVGGDTTSGPNLLFYPTFEIQRPGLALANGRVYLGFGSYNDDHPWHGWMFAYNTSDLSQSAIMCTTPNGFGGAVWEAGGGPAVDGSGNLYVLTGNGDYDGTANFGSSVLKLSPSLLILDWFTPTNWATLNSNDQDLSSGQPMLISGTNQLVFGAKDGNVYNVNTTCMGHLGGTVGGCTAPQVFLSTSPTCTSDCGIYGGSTFWNSAGFFPNVAQKAFKYTYSGTSFNTSPAASSASFSFPGATMTASSNGASNGIIWSVTVAASNETSLQPGTLRALNPADLTEYWNSDTTGHDSLGTASKFSPVVITNGKVFVPNQDSQIVVFGLIPAASMRGQVTQRGAAVSR